jgi:hypothetical protein
LPTTLYDAYIRPQVPADLPRTRSKSEDYLKTGTYGGGTDHTPYGPGVYGFNFWFNEKYPREPVPGVMLGVKPSRRAMVCGRCWSCWESQQACFSQTLNCLNSNHGDCCLVTLLSTMAGSGPSGRAACP